MPHVMNYHLLRVAVNFVDYPVVSNSMSKQILGAFQLNSIVRERILTEPLNLTDDARDR